MRNDFIPGPRYKAARERFLDSIPETASLGGAALATLAWADTYEAAWCRFADACADLYSAFWIVQVAARLVRKLEGEK